MSLQNLERQSTHVDPVGPEISWEQIGKDWLAGARIMGWQFDGSDRKFHPKQVDFMNAKDRFVCFSGGFGAGKTDPLIRKCILLSLMFPNNFGLIGRKTYPELETSTLIDFWDIVPESEVANWDGKNRIVTFKNGSKIIFFHLDVLQSSSLSDQKKALAEVKSMNLGWFAIDQAEEVDEAVFLALRGRLRRQVPFLQGMLTANPAMTWLYDYFKGDKYVADSGYKLIESSTFDNAANLPKEYIEDLMKYPEMWKRQYVFGEWSEALLADKAVFAIEYITEQRARVVEPVSVIEDLKIWKQPESGHYYRIGADPSEGVTDPCAIVVFDETTGEQVGLWSKRMPADLFAERIAFVTRVFDPSGENHEVVLEVNGIGMATLSRLKDFDNVKIYQREEINDQNKDGEFKLGWKTTASTKPLLIANIMEFLRENKIKIYSDEIIREMNTFVYTDAAKLRGFGAIPGKHDDKIMALMLACYGATPGRYLRSLVGQGYSAYKSGDY